VVSLNIHSTSVASRFMSWVLQAAKLCCDDLPRVRNGGANECGTDHVVPGQGYGGLCNAVLLFHINIWEYRVHYRWVLVGYGVASSCLHVLFCTVGGWWLVLLLA